MFSNTKCFPTVNTFICYLGLSQNTLSKLIAIVVCYVNDYKCKFLFTKKLILCVFRY